MPVSASIGTGTAKTDVTGATNATAAVQGEAGVITTPALSTAAGGTFTLTIFNHIISAASVILASVTNGSNTQGDPALATVTPKDGSVIVTIANRHASQALNGSLKISFLAIAASG